MARLWRGVVLCAGVASAQKSATAWVTGESKTTLYVQIGHGATMSGPYTSDALVIAVGEETTTPDSGDQNAADEGVSTDGGTQLNFRAGMVLFQTGEFTPGTDDQVTSVKVQRAAVSEATPGVLVAIKTHCDGRSDEVKLIGATTACGSVYSYDKGLQHINNMTELGNAHFNYEKTGDAILSATEVDSKTGLIGSNILAAVTAKRGDQAVTYDRGLTLRMSFKSTSGFTKETGAITWAGSSTDFSSFKPTVAFTAADITPVSAGDPQHANSFCLAMYTQLFEANVLQYLGGPLLKNAASGADYTRKSDFTCYAPKSATGDKEVFMQFMSNPNRMKVYSVLSQLGNKKIASPGETPVAQGGALGGVSKMSSVDDAPDAFGTPTMYGPDGITEENFPNILVLECDEMRPNETYADPKEVKEDIAVELWNAGAIAKAPVYSNTDWTVTLDLWDDDEVYRAARRLYLTRGTTKCLRWKPKTIRCQTCNVDYPNVEYTVPIYTWTIVSGSSMPAAKITYDSATSGAQLSGANWETDGSACDLADRLVGAGGESKIVYCKQNGTTAGYSQTIEIAFANQKDAEAMSGLSNAGAVNASADVSAVADDFNVVTAAPLYSLSYAVTLAAEATAFVAASPSSNAVAASAGATNASNSICKKYAQSAGGAKTVFCTSPAGPAASGLTMVQYFTTKQARLDAAVAIREVGPSANMFLYVTPSAASSSAIVTQVFRGSSEKDGEKTKEGFSAGTHPSEDPFFNPPMTAGTACKAVLALSGMTENMIYCESGTDVDGEITLKYISDTADGRTATISSGATTANDKVVRAALVGLASQTLKGVDGAKWEPFTWSSTNTLFLATYTVTRAAVEGTTAEVAASTGTLTGVTNSACKWANRTSTVYCVGTSSRMTMGWLYAADRETDMIAIAGLPEAAAHVSTVEPTGLTNQGTADKELAQATVVLTHKNIDADGPKDWALASNGKTTGATSACAKATGGGAAEKAIYCDSAKAASGDMTMKWASLAAAKKDLRLLYKVRTGVSNTDDVSLHTETNFALPKTGTLFSTVFSLSTKTVAVGADAALPIKAGEACDSIWTTTGNAVSCDSTATSMTSWYLTAANRLTDTPKVAVATNKGNVGSFEFTSAKDAAEANDIVKVVYEVEPATAETEFVATTYARTAESACALSGSVTKKSVACSSPKGAKGLKVDMTLKYLGTDTKVTPAYIAELKALADSPLIGEEDAAKQAYTLKQEGNTPDVIRVLLSAAATPAPTAEGRRRILAAGDKVSLGGFTAAESWCATLATASNVKSSIFCESSAAGKMTLSYLDNARANADVKKLVGLTTYSIQHDTDHTMTIEATVSETTAANALCSQTFVTADLTGYATCSHAAVTVAADRRSRRLATAAVTVELTFNTAASLDTAKTKFAAIDWTTVPAFSGAPSMTHTGPDTPEGPDGPDTPEGPDGPETPETPGPETTDGASLRLVGFAFLAIFVAA